MYKSTVLSSPQLGLNSIMAGIIVLDATVVDDGLSDCIACTPRTLTTSHARNVRRTYLKTGIWAHSVYKYKTPSHQHTIELTVVRHRALQHDSVRVTGHSCVKSISPPVISVIGYVAHSVGDVISRVTQRAVSNLLPVTRSDVLAGQRPLAQVHVSRVL